MTAQESRLARVIDDYRDQPTWTARDALLTAAAADALAASPSGLDEERLRAVWPTDADGRDLAIWHPEDLAARLTEPEQPR